MPAASPKPNSDNTSPQTKPRYRSDWRGRMVLAARRRKPVYILSAILQLIFGLTVVGLSMVGLVQPLWVAGLVNVAGCVSVILSGYQLYDALGSDGGHGGLVSRAMHDAINHRN